MHSRPFRRQQRRPLLATPAPHHFWLNPWSADTVDCVARDALASALHPVIIDSDREDKTVASAGIKTHPDPPGVLRHLFSRTDRTATILLLVGERDDLDEDAVRLLAALPRLGRLFNVRLALDIALADRIDIIDPVVYERINGVLFAEPTLVQIPVTAVRRDHSSAASASR